METRVNVIAPDDFFRTDDAGEPCVLSYLMVVQTHGDTGKATAQLPRVLAHALVTDRMRRTPEGWRKLQQTASDRARERGDRGAAKVAE